MSLNDEVRILQQVPLFATVNPLDLKRLAFASRRLHFEPGEVIFVQGEPGDCAYLLMNGSADVLVNSDLGQVKIAEIPGRSIVGEIAVLCESARTATVAASTAGPVDALQIGRDDLIRLLRSDGEVTMALLRVMAERLSRTTDDLIRERSRRSA